VVSEIKLLLTSGSSLFDEVHHWIGQFRSPVEETEQQLVIVDQFVQDALQLFPRSRGGNIKVLGNTFTLRVTKTNEHSRINCIHFHLLSHLVHN